MAVDVPLALGALFAELCAEARSEVAAEAGSLWDDTSAERGTIGRARDDPTGLSPFCKIYYCSLSSCCSCALEGPFEPGAGDNSCENGSSAVPFILRSGGRGGAPPPDILPCTTSRARVLCSTA